ncbi:PP2C family protein-serine/threonine phosphatase [Streptomyces sp. NPDC020141]|uniref:PP2C family protein-serine/threonine phosphatase n=1 Tax=Streptomyces sp. NPDC020141 TaxID=3365065 RepID=UPI0037B6836A
MLDIPLLLRVDVDPWVAAQNDMNDMGVCDAIEQNAPGGKPTAMSTPHLPKVAGINSPVPYPPHNATALPGVPSADPETGTVAGPETGTAGTAGTATASTSDTAADPAGTRPSTTPGPCHDPSRATGRDTTARGAHGTAPGPTAGALLQHRLADRVSDLTALHGLTGRLAGTDSLDTALRELLEAGAALLGARRGLVILEPRPAAGADRFAADHGPALTRGLGLTHAELGQIETVPRDATAHGRILEHRAGGPPRAVAHPDLLGDPSVDPRHREVAGRLGCAAGYTQPLIAETAGVLGAAVWLYDEPTAPGPRPCRLTGLYARYAAEHLARLLELEHARRTVATVTEELLPGRLPRVPGVRLAARRLPGPRGGGDWYDALPLPEGALGLSVGSVSGSGPGALAAMGRLRASLRAYAVMEGEDPVAVLSDLELLLRLTEPARTATALFAYAEPSAGRVVLAGAGHTPPLVTGERRTEFVETSLSAPLGMLACWEAPSVELSPEPGETVLLYTDGLLRRTGDPVDRAFARLRSAAASVPRAAREDPGAVADHVLNTLFRQEPDTGAEPRPGPGPRPDGEDIVLLAARFG